MAIADTLDAFRRRPASKVGLILPTGAGKTRTALRIVLDMLGPVRARRFHRLLGDASEKPQGPVSSRTAETDFDREQSDS